MESTERLVHGLLEIAPELSVLHASHLDANDTLLPHVWMGDFSRYLVGLNERVGARSGSDEESTLNALLRFIDLQFRTGPEEVKELISVSFLENIAEYAVAAPLLRARLGGALTEELETILRWSDA